MNHAGSLKEQKRLLRLELRQQRANLTPGERFRQSGRILKQLFQHPRFLNARSVLFYLAREEEVETRPLLDEILREQKKAYVPRLDLKAKQLQMIEIRGWSELKPGAYGILEPAFDPERVGNPAALDLAIVPGMAFDREGGRLGRGEGYFDRFLQEAGRAYKIGLAFKFQLVEEVPCEAHDVRVDEVLTE